MSSRAAASPSATAIPASSSARRPPVPISQKRSHHQLVDDDAATQLSTAPSSKRTNTGAVAAANATKRNSNSSRAIAVDEEMDDDEDDDDEDEDDDDDDDASDTSSCVDEYVIVTIPHTVVAQQRATHNGEITIHGIDTQRPYFHSAYTLSSSAVDAFTAARASATTTNAAGKQATVQPITEFAGTYEYSVGTNLIWEIQPPPHRDPTASSSPIPVITTTATSVGNSVVDLPAATSTNVANVLLAAAAASAASPSSNPSSLHVPMPNLEALVAASSPPPTLSTERVAATNSPAVPATATSNILFVGKTWKRLVFAKEKALSAKESSQH